MHAALQPLRDVFTYLMDAKVGIGVKVVVFGRHVLSIGLLTAFSLTTGNLRAGEQQNTSQVGSPEPPHHNRTPTAPSSIFSPQGMFLLPGPTQSTIQGAAASPTISPGSMPVSSSAHSWGGRKGRAEPGQAHGKPGEGGWRWS